MLGGAAVGGYLLWQNYFQPAASTPATTTPAPAPLNSFCALAFPSAQSQNDAVTALQNGATGNGMTLQQYLGFLQETNSTNAANCLLALNPSLDPVTNPGPGATPIIGPTPPQAPLGAGEGIQTPVLPITPVSLAGFGRFRGMGQINVESLAQAMMNGGLSPAFQPPVSYQPSYLPAGQTTTLPTWLFATDSFAQQLAHLLGGSVVQAPIPDGMFEGSGIPDTDYISVDGQQILPGNLFQPGTVLDFGSLCDAESYLIDSIPGAQFGASCTGGIAVPIATAPAASSGSSSSSGTLCSPTQILAGICAAGSPAPSPAAPAPVMTGGYPTVGAASPNIPTLPAPITPGGNSNTIIPGAVAVSSSSPPATILTGGAGSNVGNTSGAPASGSSTSTAAATCFNPLSAMLGAADFCLGPIGIVEAGLAVVLVLMMLPKGGR